MLGWDGATFDVIRPLIARGRMPHTARLMAEGAFARLRSTIPAVTPVAWTTMITGVNPGKHGILDGHQLDPETGRIRFASAAMRRAPPLWSLINAHGGRTAVLNVPVTYPPEQVNGFLAPGMFTPPGAPDAIFPADMGAAFLARFGPLADSPPKYPDPLRYLESLLAGVQTRLEMVLWLMERGPWELLFAVFMEVDRVQHFFWQYRDPAHPRHRELGDAVDRVYEALDAALGRILTAVGPDAIVALASDHGAGPLHTGVFLNAWLMDQGLLHMTRDFEKTFSRPAAGGLGLLRRVLAKAVSAVAPRAAAAMKAGALACEQARVNNLLRSIIDWERTLAWSDGMGGGIYVNPPASEGPKGRTALCRRLSAGLQGLVDPRTEKAVIEAVHWREDIYHGSMVEAAPDLILTCAPGYQIYAPHEFLINAKAPSRELFLDHPWSGRHEEYGVFVLAGPGVGGGDADRCEMADVTPTLLTLLGIPLPEGLDGHALSRALADGGPPDSASDPAAVSGRQSPDMADGGPAPADPQLAPEDEEAMKAQLKSLGYM
ncbi:alkaline phosphatase family protein [Desulfolutivibrio sulfodismutans]|nr:alkaline phosphatase family protein [Desulfolutivibrio sulfodismutans]